jgi:hypothetical protein
MTSLQQMFSSMLRRDFLRRSILGSAALTALGQASQSSSSLLAAEKSPHFVPKAKRVIFLFQSGGPSQLELMDYKPKLKELHGTELPDLPSLRNYSNWLELE